MFYYRKVKIGNRTLLINHTLGKVVKVTKKETSKQTIVSKQQFEKAGWTRKEKE